MSRSLLPAVGPILEQLDERARDLARVRRGLGEEVEELALLWGQAQRHGRVLAGQLTRNTDEQATPAAKQ